MTDVATRQRHSEAQQPVRGDGRKRAWLTCGSLVALLLARAQLERLGRVADACV